MNERKEERKEGRKEREGRKEGRKVSFKWRHLFLDYELLEPRALSHLIAEDLAHRDRLDRQYYN